MATVIEQKITAIDGASGPINDVVRSADGLARASENMEDLGQAGGDAESSLRALAGVVGMVNPELGGLIGVVAEVGGGLEGLSKGGQLLSSTFGSVGMAAGVLGVALGAGVAAWALYTAVQEDAAQAGREVADAFKAQEEEINAAKKALDSYAASLQAAQGTMDGAALQAAVLRGELAPEEAATIGRVGAYQEQRAGSEEALVKQQRALENQIAQWKKINASLDYEALQKVSAETGVTSQAQLEERLAGVSVRLRDFREETDQNVAALNELGELQLRQRQAREAEAAATQGAAEAQRRRAEAEREAEEQARALAQAEAQAAAAAALLEQQQAQAYASMLVQAQAEQALAVQAQATVAAIAELDPALSAQERAYRQTIGQLDALGSALGQAALAGKVTAEELAIAQQTLSAARAAAEAGLTEGPAAASGAGLGALQGALTGSLSAALAPMLSAVGPEGAIIAAVLGLLEQGPEQVQEVLNQLATVIPDAIAPALLTLVQGLPEFAIDLINGIITALPDLLISVLTYAGPLLAIQVASGLLLALPEMIPALAVALGEVATELPEILFSTATLPIAITRGFVGAIPEMVQAFRDMELVEDFREAFRDALKDAVDLLRPGGGKGQQDRWSFEVLDGGRPIARMIRRAQASRGGGVR